jgi:hypothetical protein
MHGLPHELHLHMVQRLLGLPALYGLDLVLPQQVLQESPALFLLPQKQTVPLLQPAAAVRSALQCKKHGNFLESLSLHEQQGD